MSPVNDVEPGFPEGKTVIYFHGAPGSPDECSIFEKYAIEYGLNIICYDRFSADLSLHNQDYFKHLSNIIIDRANGSQVDIIGFSIGCYSALETCLYLGGNVRNLHLISAAAPLNAGNFLSGMAGEMIFLLAIKYPIFFALLSYWQALISKLAPNVLFKMLFSSVKDADEKLSKTTEFKEYITPVLKNCFSKNVKGYIREINQYVTPWGESISKCNSNTYIWHGASDNWSPVSMVNYLSENIANVSSIELMKGLSHYTCLYAAVPKVCSQIAKA